MIGLRTVLFLFGTFVLASSKAFLPTVGLEIAKASTGRLIEEDSHGAPFISKFIQEGTNVFYKPHFTMTSHSEQPHVIVENEHCNKEPLMPVSALIPPVLDEPLKIIETVIPAKDFEPPHIKEVIEIKPLMPEVVMSMPVAAAPVLGLEPTIISETPVVSPMPLSEFPVPVLVNEVLTPELPTLPMTIESLPTPAVVEEPIIVPETPVLSTFTIPEEPALTLIEEHPSVTLMPELQVPIEPTAVILQEPVFIPEAPILPPLIMPELPTLVEAMPVDPIPTMIEEPVAVPEAPALVITKIPAPAMVEESELMPFVPAFEPVVIPEAPVLPPFTMPELPKPAIIEVMPELPVLTPIEPASVIVEGPTVIPEAPLLPPLTLPEPVVLEEKISVKEDKIEMPVLLPTAPMYHRPIFPQQPCLYPFTVPCPLGPYANPVGIPPPHMSFSEVPHAPVMHFIPPMSQVPIYNDRIEINKVVMPSLPSPVSLPTECAQGIIAERILPNMVGQAVVAAPALINPVPAPYIRL